MIGNGNILADAVSKFGAVVTLDAENEAVFDENMFSISKRIAIGASSTNDIVIDPTACTCFNLVFLPIVFKAFGAGPVTIDMYIGTDSDPDGTVYESVNRKNDSTNPAELVVQLNPTINNIGTLLPVNFVILSDGTPATANAGGESREAQIFLPNKNFKYMFRLINLEAVAAHGHVSMNWFEVS